SRAGPYAAERRSRGTRSVAAPVRDASGATVAAVNVTCHAAETPVAELTSRHLPLLLATAGGITRAPAGTRLAPGGEAARAGPQEPPPAAAAGHGGRHHTRVGQPGALAGARS